MSNQFELGRSLKIYERFRNQVGGDECIGDYEDFEEDNIIAQVPSSNPNMETNHLSGGFVAAQPGIVYQE